MTLLHIVLNTAEINRNDVIVVNVDHGIRTDSAADTELVLSFCQKNGVEFFAVKASVPERMNASGRGTEEEARELRREVFLGLLAAKKAEYVLLAHNKNDVAETVLMNALRGTGISGLKAMPVLSSDGLLRPLVGVSRAEIDAYVAENNVPYRDDSTNADPKYTRNFIRHKIMPLLSERFDAVENLANLAEKARADDEYISRFLDLNAIEFKGDKVRLRAEFLQKDEAISARYAVSLLRRLTADYTAQSIKSVMDCAGLSSGKKREIGGGIIAVREYDYVVLYRQKPIEAAEAKFVLGKIPFGKFVVTAAKASSADLNALRSRTSILTRTLFIDGAKVPKTAVLRTRKQGDSFRPFGGGTRPIKEYFTDMKIPLSVRDTLPLLVDGDRVLAVLGCEIDRALKVEGGEAIKLSIEDTDEWKE